MLQPPQLIWGAQCCLCWSEWSLNPQTFWTLTLAATESLFLLETDLLKTNRKSPKESSGKVCLSEDSHWMHCCFTESSLPVFLQTPMSCHNSPQWAWLCCLMEKLLIRHSGLRLILPLSHLDRLQGLVFKELSVKCLRCCVFAWGSTLPPPPPTPPTATTSQLHPSELVLGGTMLHWLTLPTSTPQTSRSKQS